MRLNLVLELLDIPGQLLDVLRPMGRLGANIVAVIHQRDVKTDEGKVPVQITIEGDQKTLNRVIDDLEENGIQVMEVDGVLRREKITTILVGNIVDQDLKDTVNLLNQLPGVRVADLDLKMSDSPEKSASKIVMEAREGIKQEVLFKIKEIGAQKGLLVINEI
ncbi:MAG TPA: amino acid-binding protein [Methanobacteriaceae archaeon]|nr:amino acid-binding protein [Methanobacteriaceae archaeon]